MIGLRIDEEGIAWLRLERPEVRNAVPLEGWRAIAAAASRALDQGARVLVLGGEPSGAFCSGADVAGFAAFREGEAARTEFRRAIRDGLDALRDLALPTIALVEGACYGAGVALAIACDIRVAGPQARFAVTPAKLGISYPQEDVHRLVTLVGAGQAARLCFSAASIDAAESVKIGLAEIHAEDPQTAAAELARTIAANAPASLATLKRSIRLAARGVVSDAEQDREFEALLGSEELFRRLDAHRARPR